MNKTLNTVTDLHAAICLQGKDNAKKIAVLSELHFRMKEAVTAINYFARRSPIFGMKKVKEWKEKAVQYAQLFTTAAYSSPLVQFPQMQEGLNTAFQLLNPVIQN